MIKRAGVVGAGAMGSEIAQTISSAGIPVALKDINDEALSRGMARIKKIYASGVEKGRLTAADAEAKIKLVVPTTDYGAFQDVDFVVEAAPEFLDLKKKTFQDLDGVCPPHAILATNTSSLSISELAANTRRPSQVVGMHFFNPAHVMKLVEVVPGLNTSPESVATAMEFSRAIRKLPVRVEECPGFLVNRLLLPYLNECAIALQEGSGSMKDIDEAMKAFGWPMGPFTLMDMLGLDVCAEVARILRHAHGPRARAAELFDAMVTAGRLGQKSGVGFYEYGGQAKQTMGEVLEGFQSSAGLKRVPFEPMRPMALMINEAIMCVQERVSSPEEVDVAMVAGTGFPQDKGGPLHYADALGLDLVLKMMERYAEILDVRFWPHFRLKTMVGAGMIGVKTRRGFFSY